MCNDILLYQPGIKLAEALGQPLPADAMPGRVYQGPNRIVVPTQRTSLAGGENLKLKAIVLSQSPVKTVTLKWRPMGSSNGFEALSMKRSARSVYNVELTSDPIAEQDIEYYVEATNKEKEIMRYPVSAPALCQTVIMIPEAK